MKTLRSKCWSPGVRCPRPWPALALLLLIGVSACERTPQAPGPSAPVQSLAVRDAAGVKLSLVWGGADAEFVGRVRSGLNGPQGQRDFSRWSQEHGGQVEVRSSVALELSIDSPLAGLEAALGLVRAATLGAARGAESAAAQDHRAPLPNAQRRAALSHTEALSSAPAATEADPSSQWHWHASALCAAPDSARVDRALTELERAVKPFAKSASTAAVTGAERKTRVLLLESNSSAPTQVRWLSPPEASGSQHSAERALWCVHGARLARTLQGWTFVPASVDALGQREPAYLYTEGEVAGVAGRIAALRAALAVPDHGASANLVLAAKSQRAAFARAQLNQDEFRLRAMHGGALQSFEADALAIESLDETELQRALDPMGSRWTVMGPPAAWGASLATIGEVETRAPAPSATADAAAESKLEQMWSALGGEAPWRELRTLHTLSVLRLEEIGSMQGVELWVDFEAERFALAQAINTQETVVVATASEAWMVDGAKGVDLSEVQARKLRQRQERTLFALLRRLAREPGHGGLELRLVDGRLRFAAAGSEWCWLELDAAGLPTRLGYALESEAEESVYEFEQWRTDGCLAYPTRTLHRTRATTLDLQHVECNGTMDPWLWTRKAR